MALSNTATPKYYGMFRDEVRVHMALADQGYNINQLKNGVWASGRVAYSKRKVNIA